MPFLYTVTYGNLGCRGGNMYTSYEYVYKNFGVDDASFYPYTGRVSRLEESKFVGACALKFIAS